MRTAVVILNWNTKKYLSAFLPPLLDSCKGIDAEVVVADNASSDGSLDFVRSEFPSVRTIALDDNFGFTGGYNRAIAELLACCPEKPEYLVLINSDIAVGKGWLEPLCEWMDTHGECGVCGPKLLALEQDGDVFIKTSGFEYAGAAGGFLDRYGFPYCRGRVLSRCEEDRGQYDDFPPEVFWVSGACLMTRTSLWEELGGLDEGFFAHFEEIDYCWRAQLHGYSVCAVSGSAVHHLGGGTLAQNSPFKLMLNYRNSLWMLEKNLGASIGGKAARRRICGRLWIDRAAAAAYLLTGRIASYKAVRQAHKEYRRGKDRLTVSQKGAKVAGLGNICIILQYALKGRKIFDFLRIYENSH